MVFYIKSLCVKRLIFLCNAFTFDLNSCISTNVYEWPKILHARDFGINGKDSRVEQRAKVKKKKNYGFEGGENDAKMYFEDI